MRLHLAILLGGQRVRTSADIRPDGSRWYAFFESWDLHSRVGRVYGRTPREAFEVLVAKLREAEPLAVISEVRESEELVVA